MALIFKVPGSVNLSVLPDLFEDVCRGPIPPDAVIIVHLKEDSALDIALTGAPARIAMVRFSGRIPLLKLEVAGASFSMRVKGLSIPRQAQKLTMKNWTLFFSKYREEWLKEGLGKIFKPEEVLVSAPAGYAFQKPSKARSTYFIRTEQALATSGCVAFVALTILSRLLLDHRKLPDDLQIIFVDTMSVSTVAYALREMLSLLKRPNLPQIESFHSYGGLDQVRPPLPGSSLCLVSASSSMNLHREWVRANRVPDRDVLTLLTFSDARDAKNALFSLPATARPKEEVATASYDIRIEGENFVPASEPPRKVLLRKKAHEFPEGTSIYAELAGSSVFGVYGNSQKSTKRRGLFVDGEKLVQAEGFRAWLSHSILQSLKASTRKIVYQEDDSSLLLARNISAIAQGIGLRKLDLVPFGDVSNKSIDRDAGLIAVAAVAGKGSNLLSLSRALRGLHLGPRLFVVGLQVAERGFSSTTFDANLKSSSHGAAVDVLRFHMAQMSAPISESFEAELRTLYDFNDGVTVPAALAARANAIRRGGARGGHPVFLPSGEALTTQLALNPDFVFWKPGYKPGAHQAEVLATISAILQRARDSAGLTLANQLSSPLLQQVTLDPENFSRFDDAIIQASLLRSAAPSELDFRGDVDGSRYIREFLGRQAQRLGSDQDCPLEFLTALAVGRLQVASADLAAIVSTFEVAIARRRTPLARSVGFILKKMAQPKQI